MLKQKKTSRKRNEFFRLQFFYALEFLGTKARRKEILFNLVNQLNEERLIQKSIFLRWWRKKKTCYSKFINLLFFTVEKDVYLFVLTASERKNLTTHDHDTPSDGSCGMLISLFIFYYKNDLTTNTCSWS